MENSKITLIRNVLWTCLLLAFSCTNQSFPPPEGLLLTMDFDTTDDASIQLAPGLTGKAWDMSDAKGLAIDDLGTDWFADSMDFSVSVWVKSSNIATDTTLILSNTDFRKREMGIYGHRRINKGFAFYCTQGAWGWNIGNGKAHYNYEPIFSDQPISDGKWHQLVFTYHAALREARLFYDGQNRAVLSLGDLKNHDFYLNTPLTMGKSQISPGYNSFQGLLDELQVWDKTLSPEEVSKDYQSHLKPKEEPEFDKETLSILNWNIWHGGSHYLKERDGFDGVELIIEMIENSGADIVLMQETYGSGSRISSNLGFYYYEACSAIGAVWGANLSVMSRYPIEEVYLNENPSNYGKNYAFNNAGARIRLTDDKKILAFTNWYNANKPEDLEGALKGFHNLLEDADNIPHVWAGDFNSVSHLDDGKGESGHSRLIIGAGFNDSYRELYPDPEQYPCITSPSNEKRIDYIYYKGSKLALVEVGKIIEEGFQGLETPNYPSDHLGITAKFKVN